MKKFALLLSFAFIGIQTFAQEVYQSKAMNVRFFSTTPMEDIEAKTANATSIITTAKNDILFMIQVKSFTFKSSLMQEHFNENYMESTQFPKADFKGLVASGAMIIDVRSPQEFDAGHVKNSKNIPLQTIQKAIPELKKSGKVVITVCRSGSRSGMAKSILKSAGIEVYNGGPWNVLSSKI